MPKAAGKRPVETVFVERSVGALFTADSKSPEKRVFW
jgi:hypothetical protein